MDWLIGQYDLFSKDIICDLSETSGGGDAATLGSLIARAGEVQQQGKKLVFFRVPEMIKAVIDLSKTGPLFTIFETEAEAINKVTP